MAEHRVVPEHEVKAWLAGWGVAVPRGAAVAAPGEIPEAAADLEPPLVVKAYGPGLVHKSDRGAVRLDLPDAAAARAAAERMAARLDPAGFLVEEQAPPGVELIIGAVRDPVFGPVVLAGLGGVWTEALADTAVRLAPLTERDASEMLRGLRGAPLLTGGRGHPGVDLDALTRLLMTLAGPGGALATLGDTYTEFELNPVIATPHGAIAADARLITAPSPGGAAPETGRASDFRTLFHPRKVAVAGASVRNPGFGNLFLGFYRETGVPVVAVHPDADEIDGVPAVRDLAAAGADYALVAVPAERCAAVVASGGTPFVQVMSGGFGEAGESGLEEGLVAAARRAGSRLLGPNCMGVYCPSGRQTFLGGGPGRPGRIAVVSQSGGMAGEIIKVGERRGLAFSKVATVGNSADVTPAELVRYLADDPDTAVLGLYLEDPRDGRGLYEALRATAGRLPAVALVGGRSTQGRAAAVSHTGGMTGDTRVWDAVAAQAGLALVHTQDDLIGALDALDLHAHRDVSGGGNPEGAVGRDAPGRDKARDGILVIGPSGGASVLAADAFDRTGAVLPALPEACLGDLRALGLGAGSSLANPLEIPAGPRGRPDLVRTAVTAITAHAPMPDVVCHLNAQSFFTYGHSAEALQAYAHQIGALQDALPRTRVTFVLRNAECAPPGVEDAARAVARGHGVPLYRSMESAAAALAAVAHVTRAR